VDIVTYSSAELRVVDMCDSLVELLLVPEGSLANKALCKVVGKADSFDSGLERL